MEKGLLVMKKKKKEETRVYTSDELSKTVFQGRLFYFQPILHWNADIFQLESICVDIERKTEAFKWTWQWVISFFKVFNFFLILSTTLP